MLHWGLGACTGIEPGGDSGPTGEEICDDAGAVVDISLPPEIDEAPETEEDANCGGGNNPDGVDPDNPGKGH
ncbi:MAG: hypothetical protein HUJ27_15495 [Rhodobacteraceae bacterium]|nr:hypothetical protein [Paracoccaceae bacterium]